MNASFSRIAHAAVAGLLLPVLGAWQPVHAQITWADVLTFQPPAQTPTYSGDRLARAGADECFDGIGVDYPPRNPDGSCSAGVPKANQAYVWGLTQAGLGDPSFAGDQIWFGTLANPLCVTAAGVLDATPGQNVSWVCEYGQSMAARREVAPLPAPAGDWRSPRAYSFNLQTRQLTERTPRDLDFHTISGLRSAGSVGSTVILAGPNFRSDVVFAAWDASGSGSYLGSCRATGLRNIRQWITVNGVLYAGAAKRPNGGVILRWRGTAADPFAGAGNPSDYCGFEIVGELPDLPAYLTVYDGQRLAASVWSDSHRESPDAAAMAAPGIFSAGVYLGPPFGPDGGYDTADATRRWLKLWGPSEYDPDPVVAAVAAGGAIAFWKGWLWFGTIHNTLGAYLAHSQCGLPSCYGPPADADQQVDLLFKISRAASLWRARLVPGGPPEVQMLYGATALPALVPGTRTFESTPTGWTPRFGAAGMDNPFLTYAWAATASDDDLLFGFYDYRYVFDVRLGIVTGRIGTRTDVDPRRGYGADLWRFTDPEAPAQPEATLGLGNFSNYGVRNMLRLDGGPDVIVGTANGLNLEPEGGWELHLLTAPATTRPPLARGLDDRRQ